MTDKTASAGGNSPDTGQPVPESEPAPTVEPAAAASAVSSGAVQTTGAPPTAVAHDLHGPHDPSASRLGMTILIASLSVLFGASLLVYWFLRLILMKGEWPPQGYQPLPPTIWLSTALLAVSSYTIERGRSALRAGSTTGLARLMLVSALIGWAFLLAQAFNWAELLGAYAQANVPIDRAHGLHAMLFILLTVLHALHVLGGVIPLTVIAVRSRKPADAVPYPPPAHGTVDAMAVYWHFLGIVWLVMFVTIFLPGG